jgi:nitrogen fixation/metabolism regulation signal transduction histidine kinase
MECLEHIIFIKANSSSIISVLLGIKYMMMVFMLVLLSQYLWSLLSAAASALAKSKLLQVLN